MHSPKICWRGYSMCHSQHDLWLNLKIAVVASSSKQLLDSVCVCVCASKATKHFMANTISAPSNILPAYGGRGCRLLCQTKRPPLPAWQHPYFMNTRGAVANILTRKESDKMLTLLSNFYINIQLRNSSAFPENFPSLNRH